jgi:hypothetical protein
MPKVITKKQQRLLFSKNSPISKRQQEKLAREIREGKVKITKRKNR